MRNVAISARYVLWTVVVLTCLGCFGGCPATSCSEDESNSPPPLDWEMTTPATATGGPGDSAFFDVTLENHSSIAITLELDIGAPTGWSASVAEGSVHLNNGQTKVVRATVNIPAGATMGSTGVVSIRASRTVDNFRTKNVTVTVGGSLTTGFVKLTDFAPEADGAWVSRFRLENGAPGPIIGSFGFQFVPNIAYWCRPSADYVLGENRSKEYELVAVPLDSVQAVGPVTAPINFGKAGTVYSYSSSFNVPGNNERGFRIQVDQGLRNLIVGSEAQYLVTVDLPAGKAGRYTLAVEGLHNTLSHTITPEFADFDAGGGAQHFTLVVLRDTTHPGQGHATYEPVLVGTHDSISSADFRQVFPIYCTD